MAILPAGFALPPWPYLVVLAAGVVAVAGGLWRLAPPITADTVLGLVPWMTVGAALHALYVLDAAPAAIAPLLGAPAVYATAFIALGLVWGIADARVGAAPAVARLLALVGAGVFVLAAGAVLLSGVGLELGWPLVGLGVAGAVTVVVWQLLRRLAPGAVATGWPGVVVVFAHALDGVSTAIGVDILGFGERTPASRVIMDVAAGLPTAEVIGVGWLFVLVKIALALLVVALFADFVREEESQGNLLLAFIAAVGFGPGVYNLLLFSVSATPV
jgi:uncharacterized membrane protein